MRKLHLVQLKGTETHLSSPPVIPPVHESYVYVCQCPARRIARYFSDATWLNSIRQRVACLRVCLSASAAYANVCHRRQLPGGPLGDGEMKYDCWRSGNEADSRLCVHSHCWHALLVRNERESRPASAGRLGLARSLGGAAATARLLGRD